MRKLIASLLISLFLTQVFLCGHRWRELAIEKNPEVKDCFENLNRATFAFNQGLDNAIFEPVAKGYRKLPSPIRIGTSNFLK